MALNHNPESDAIAALPVMLFHAGLGSFRGGLACVDVFFVMIGYTLRQGGKLHTSQVGRQVMNRCQLDFLTADFCQRLSPL